MNNAEIAAPDRPLSANSSAYSVKNGIVWPSSAQPTARRASRRAGRGSGDQRNRGMAGAYPDAVAGTRDYCQGL
jgi:hypothetical protein